MTKFQSLHEDFTSALSRFEEVLKEKKTDIVRDSAIKRFEIAFDLAWKTIKAFLEERHNSACVSPKTCFREAFRVGLIEYDEAWLNLADERNLTAHTYQEALAEKVYQGLPEALQRFKTLKAALQNAQKEKG
jgi:nucleotidyltransferase substrate binding protein (TIGR01987 family)